MIDWRNLESSDVQMATILYNDRVNTYRQMKVLDAELDETQPKSTKVKELAELRIRNLQCFDELQAYNDTGKFLYQHPLIAGKSQYKQLEVLFQTDTAGFLKQYNNVVASVKRYRAYVKRSNRAKFAASDKANLSRYLSTEALFKTIIQENKK